VPGIYDTQCGFKMFTHDAAKTVFPLQRLDAFAFDVEVLYRCRACGFGIAEVPIDWTDVAGSKVRLVRDAIRMLVDVCRIPFLAPRTPRAGASPVAPLVGRPAAGEPRERA
jgi:dolichyl-phosphate beta-glucosyltransferase